MSETGKKVSDPIAVAAEALRAVPGLTLKSRAKRMEIAHVVIDAYHAAVEATVPPRDLTSLGTDPNAPLEVVKMRTRNNDRG
jgi:hypothetical protein